MSFSPLFHTCSYRGLPRDVLTSETSLSLLEFTRTSTCSSCPFSPLVQVYVPYFLRQRSILIITYKMSRCDALAPALQNHADYLFVTMAGSVGLKGLRLARKKTIERPSHHRHRLQLPASSSATSLALWAAILTLAGLPPRR